MPNAWEASWPTFRIADGAREVFVRGCDADYAALVYAQMLTGDVGVQIRKREASTERGYYRPHDEGRWLSGWWWIERI